MKSPCTDAALERSYLTHLLSMGSVGDATALSVSDYAVAAHRQVAEAITAVAARGETVEPFGVEVELKRALGANAPIGLLGELMQGPASIDGDRMMRRLQKLASSRRRRENLLRAAHETENENDEAAVEHARIAIDEAPLSDGQIEAADVVARLGWSEHLKGRREAACRTGMPVLDNAIGSLRPGTMTVIGGRTGSGKSSLALTVAINSCRRTQTKTGIVSCEDARSVWAPRILGHLIPGRSEDDYTEHELEDAFAEAKLLGLEFAWRLNRPLSDVIGSIRALVRAGCRLIVVDYLQAVRLNSTSESRHVPTSNAAQAIKGECQSHNVPLILCSQLKRAQDNPFKEPHAGDLKESGDLENMAEVVMLLWNTSDKEGDPTLGKVAKVKWSAKRPRFVLERSPASGIVTGVVHQDAPTPGQRWGGGARA